MAHDARSGAEQQVTEHPDSGVAFGHEDASVVTGERQCLRHSAKRPWIVHQQRGAYFRVARSTAVTMGKTNSPAAVSGRACRKSRTWASS